MGHKMGTRNAGDERLGALPGGSRSAGLNMQQKVHPGPPVDDECAFEEEARPP